MIRPAEQQHFLPDRAEQREHWHLPVDLTAYDRSPAFRKQELLDLDQVMKRLFLPPVLPASLERVIQPINDVLEVSTSYLKNRQYARRTLLVEMQRRRTPFWAWTSEDWMDILRKNSTEFEQRYPGAPTCRQQVLTIAYLLCDFTDFHKLGAFLRKTLADTTFGATHMEATIQQVVEGTRQWGLTRRNDLALYSVVREALLTNRSPY